jgi:fermentation-respiration switch protein FrsA (DUF1100 family)
MSAAFRRMSSVLSVLALRAPLWKRSRGWQVGRSVALASYAYLGVLVVLLALENRFLFHPLTAAEDWEGPPPGLAIEDVELTGGGGVRLHAWWTTPPDWKPEQGAVLYCHGNAGNLSHRGEALRDWRDSLHLAVLIFDYPGYGKSEGQPSEAGCYAAGDAAFDWLVQVQHVSPDRIILYGGSLGGAIATDLAVRKEHRALVLASTFTSLPDMAQKQFPWLPVRWLVRNKLDNLAKIGKVRGPVFITHGTADDLIPFSQGERLFAAANEPKQFHPRPGQGHNDTPGSDFFSALGQFLTSRAPLPITSSSAARRTGP